VSDPH